MQCQDEIVSKIRKWRKFLALMQETDFLCKHNGLEVEIDTGLIGVADTAAYV